MKSAVSNKFSDPKVAIPVMAAGLLLLSVLPLLYFGLMFVFVMIPLGALMVIGYRVHLQRLTEKTSEIEEASRVQLATIEALASAIDARDGDGIGHVRRTQIYAVGLGRILGLPEDEIEALRTGALLHGIGKLAIPDHILNKPGTLTPAEMKKVMINSDVAASILEKIGFDYPVVPTVKYHHERWDGKGYPEGLSGAKIPMTARILAVADVFDTLRGARPYRPAKSREVARETIQHDAGTRFDPTVVTALVRNLGKLEEEIRAARLDYNDISSHAHRDYVEQIKLANREVFSLYELAREFGTTASLDETLELFSMRVSDFVPFSTCAIYLIDGDKKHASVAHVRGDNAELLRNHRIKIGKGATGYVLDSREKIQNADPSHDFIDTLPDLCRTYKTLTAIPLTADQETVGVVTLYTSELQCYGEEHIRLLETISRIAADAIVKSVKHAEARTHALTDPMTGLPNARSLQVQFEKEVARASRSEASFQLLMLDLDGFKLVNDSFGHKVGDALLKDIGAVIRHELREYDFLARYGGDEFVALIPETSEDDVAELCRRIEEAVNRYQLPIDDERYASVGVSLGSSDYPKHGSGFDQLVIAADKAMYERKTSRKREQAAKAAEAAKSAKAAENEIIPIAAVEEEELSPELVRMASETFIVELDESHVVSNAVN